MDLTYDALGRVSNRRELNNVSSLSDTVFTTINRETSVYRSSGPGESQPSSVTYRTGESGAVLQQKSFIYDGFGRLDIISTTIGTETFATQTSYDQYSRVFQQFDAAGDAHGLRYVYANGYVSQLKEARERWKKIRPFVAIAIAAWNPGALLFTNSILAGAATGFLAGGIATGTTKGAFTGAVAGAVLGAIRASGWSDISKPLASRAARTETAMTPPTIL